MYRYQTGRMLRLVEWCRSVDVCLTKQLIWSVLKEELINIVPSKIINDDRSPNEIREISQTSIKVSMGHEMKKKRPFVEEKDQGAPPPLFLCQDRQCSSPMMTRAYGAERSLAPEEHGESEDLREHIPVKKKVHLGHPKRE